MASAPRHLRIFIASPGDVRDEREIALSVLDNLPYDPLLREKITIQDVAWDKQGAGAPILAGVTPQASITAGLPRPSQCDIVVVIFWSRMGMPLPASYQKADGSRYESGTEWEYEEAVASYHAHGSPYVLLYRRKQAVMWDADDPSLDERRLQYEKVKRFFSGLKNADGSASGGYREFDVPGDFRECLEHDLKSLIARILEKPGGEIGIVAPPKPWPGSPFPGLRAFTSADAPIFFGREREIDALIARIMEQRFVAVVGASGSGKSSLVAAGVIPRLQLTTGSEGSREWLTLQFTPDRLGNGDPFASLAAAVLQAFPHMQHKGLASKLREDPDLLATLLPPRTLVFVDQFEELFTTVPPSQRAPFVDLLGRVHAIITVRADFYGHFVELPALARLVENGTFPLAAPGVAALYDMSTRPAARAALTFEDSLPQRILDDTGQEPGALALMAYTLDELYRRGLTHAAYEHLGGVQGAIGKRSESVFTALGEEEQAALPRVFRELVEVDERGTATRQRAPRVRVAATPEAERLTDALTEARLLVQSRGENGEPIVEVAHEALFRSWSRLAEWIRSSADDLRLLRQLRTAAVEWDRSGRRDHFLWPHERLAPVYALHDRLKFKLDELLAEFIVPESERIAETVRSGLSKTRERAAIERLGEIGPSAARSLVACLGFARDNETRSDIYHALSRLGDVAAPHLVEAVMYERHGLPYAVKALTYLDPGAGAHVASRLLFDRNPEVRAEAAFLVAHARAEREIPTLCNMLRTDAPDVQRAAIVALATFDSRATLDYLLRVVEGYDAPLPSIALSLINGLTGRNYPFTPSWIGDDRLLPLILSNPVLRRLPALIQATTVLARKSHGTLSQEIENTLILLLSPKMIEASVSAESSDSEIRRLFEVLVSTRSRAIGNLLWAADPRLQRHAVRSICELVVTPGFLRLDLGLPETESTVRKRLDALLRHDDKQMREAAKHALMAIDRLPKR